MKYVLIFPSNFKNKQLKIKFKKVAGMTSWRFFCAFSRNAPYRPSVQWGPGALPHLEGCPGHGRKGLKRGWLSCPLIMDREALEVRRNNSPRILLTVLRTGTCQSQGPGRGPRNVRHPSGRGKPKAAKPKYETGKETSTQSNNTTRRYSCKLTAKANAS